MAVDVISWRTLHIRPIQAVATCCCFTFLWFDGAEAFGEVVEYDEDEKQEGVAPFLAKHTEPFGAALIAYVDEGSKNHWLLKRLAKQAKANGTDEDPIVHLGIHALFASNWKAQGQESLVMSYRKPFKDIWPQVGLSVMDGDDIVFKKQKGVTWKEKEVRAWLLNYSYPLINTRTMDKDDGAFPEARYFGNANTWRGLALVTANLTGDNEINLQWHLLRALLPYAESFRGRLRFSILERTKGTRELRKTWGTGIDLSYESELLIIDDIKSNKFEGLDLVNHWHGHPKKYRLQNITDAALLDAFFDGFAKGKLKPFWVSTEEWNTSTITLKKNEIFSRRVTGNTFESVVYEQNPKKAQLLAFFNDDAAEGCEACVRGRRIWESVAKAVHGRKKLRTRFEILSIDQSANEHPESRVPGRLFEPMIMWYPPGNTKTRHRERRRLDTMSKRFDEEHLMRSIEDLLMEEFDEAEL